MAALIQFKNGVEGVTLRLENRVSRIGRGSDNEITINDELVSKDHAEIEARENDNGQGYDYFIKDKESTNGTYVNDKKVDEQLLKHEDVVRVGVNHFRFVDDANDDLSATTRIQKTWIPGIYISKRNPK
ncbi:MAG: FHA domain-containing protein [Gammaproteobacteria bacterium]|jgi:pSer/pThr/pTyr-binding forkhead associated (FHA) protein|nr:FHA domain-containing protein [Gammaproteobacteria bacterium]